MKSQCLNAKNTPSSHFGFESGGLILLWHEKGAQFTFLYVLE